MKLTVTNLRSLMVCLVMTLAILPNLAFAQTCGGTIRRGVNAAAPRSNHFLDPNADGRIVIPSVGAGFSDCAKGYVDEMLEFEALTNPTGCSACQVGWTKIALGSEIDGDLWAGGAGCGATDIVPDSPTGTYAYFTVRDPDGICSNGDELLIFRIRLDATVNGSFSYAILFDADGLLGPDDPNGVVCGTKGANGGFEYEIVANPANGSTIEVRNIDGVYGTYGTNATHNNSVATSAYSNATNYHQADACRSICSTSPCNSAGAAYHTFAVRLSDVGQVCGTFDFRFAGMSASSGNGTVSSGTSLADLGGAGLLDCGAASTIPCNCCNECNDVNSAYFCGASAGAIENCLMGCVTGCVATTNNPLPVVLGNFYGTYDSRAVRLNWITVSESGSDYFEVARSSDGVNFKEIGRVQGAGQSASQLRYEITDPTPHNGLNYYRLKQVDVDGKASYLNTIVISTNGEFLVTMPTVVSAPQLDVKIYNESGQMEFSIYDIQGRVREHRSVEGRLSSLNFDISTLEGGVYFLHAQSGTAVKRIKFVKL